MLAALSRVRLVIWLRRPAQLFTMCDCAFPISIDTRVAFVGALDQVISVRD